MASAYTNKWIVILILGLVIIFVMVGEFNPTLLQNVENAAISIVALVFAVSAIYIVLKMVGKKGRR